jgi:hypothetical protein
MTSYEGKTEPEIIADMFKLFCQVFHRDPRRGLEPMELVKAQVRLSEREKVAGSLEAAAQDFQRAIGHLSASVLDRSPDWIADLVKSREVFETLLSRGHPPEGG